MAARGVGVKLFANRTNRPMRDLLALSYTLKSDEYGEPTIQRWSPAGQLAVGMADGSFVIFDSRTFKSFGPPRGGSGAHHTCITAADWMPGPRAALALGSISTIKVRRQA